jgi:oligopeptide transport system substrate-binding protein
MKQTCLRGLPLVFLALFTVTSLVSLNGCTKKEESTNTFKIALKDDVKTLDPANAYDSVSLLVSPNVYETPLQYKYLSDQLELEPLLADSLPVYSKDGLTATLKLKKGVMFQDDPCFKANGGKGREVKAQDFLFEFKRLALPAIQSQGSWIFEGKIVGFSEFEKKLAAAKPEDFQKAFDEPIPGFTIKDDYTIEFKLMQPYPLLNYILAMSFTAPVAKEAADAYADKDGNLRDHPVGTGPYSLQTWETNQKIILVKNPNYKGIYPSTGSDKFKAAGFLADAGKPLPFIDTLDFEVIKEEQPRLLRFEKGDIDGFELMKDTFRASMTDATHLHDDLAQKGDTYSSEDSLVMYYVDFNLSDKILQNKYLRQAISSAVNREQWMDTFDQYRSKKEVQLCPPGIADRIDNAAIKYDYNVERAKALLAKAGYPEGKGLPTLNFDFRGAETKYRQMGEMFVQQLGAIGIKVNVILNTFPAYLEKMKQGNLQVSLGGWTFDYPDVENGYQLLYGPNKAPGPNDGNYSNPKYDELYKKLAIMPAGTPGRKAIVQQMEDIIQEDVPWGFGYYMATYWLTQGKVKNFRVAEIIQNKYKYVRLEQPKK